MQGSEALITAATFQRMVWLAAGLMLLAGVAVATIYGIRERGTRGVVRGLAVGLLGPLVAAAWVGFNAVLERFGLDSVAGLLLCFGLFVAAGMLIGLGYARLWRPRERDVATVPTDF